METKVGLAFDPFAWDKTMRYIAKKNLIRRLQSLGISYTLDCTDPFLSTIIAGSGMDFFAWQTRIAPKAMVLILAASEVEDYLVSRKGQISLSQNALQAYRNADELLIYSKAQEDFLQSQMKNPKVRYLDPLPTFDNDTLLPSEKASFRRFYQIPRDKTLIVSYGSYADIDSLELFTRLARLCPEMEFLFFGPTAREYTKMKYFEFLTYPENIHFENALPEELYHSALLSIDACIFTTSFLTYPDFLFDLKARNVPVFGYSYQEEKPWEKDCSIDILHDFGVFYRKLMGIKDIKGRTVPGK